MLLVPEEARLVARRTLVQLPSSDCTLRHTSIFLNRSCMTIKGGRSCDLMDVPTSP